MHHETKRETGSSIFPKQVLKQHETIHTHTSKIM